VNKAEDRSPSQSTIGRPKSIVARPPRNGRHKGLGLLVEDLFSQTGPDRQTPDLGGPRLGPAVNVRGRARIRRWVKRQLALARSVGARGASTLPRAIEAAVRAVRSSAGGSPATNDVPLGKKAACAQSNGLNSPKALWNLPRTATGSIAGGTERLPIEWQHGAR